MMSVRRLRGRVAKIVDIDLEELGRSFLPRSGRDVWYVHLIFDRVMGEVCVLVHEVMG